MGRHSAPEEPEDGSAAVATAPAEPGLDRGRHYAPQVDDVEGRPEEPAVREVDDRAGDGPGESADGSAVGGEPVELPGAPAGKPGRRERATQADLRLLREHPALRARCVAAALVPFVVYTVVLFALARPHIYVLWLWAPIIAAGVLVGAVLDAAHKKLDPPPPPDE